MTTKRKNKSTKQPSKILVLCTCDADMSAYDGFIWPSAGAVIAPDWNPDPAIDYGRGLHGLAWGDSGIAASIGNGGTVRAGPNGLLIACWWDGDAKRYHAATGEVGVDGIKADTDYRVVDGKLAEVAP